MTEAMESIAVQLSSGGVRPAKDERDVNPPCVLIRPPLVNYQFGGCHEGVWELVAIVPDTGTWPSVVALDELLAATQAAMAGEIKVASPSSFPSETGAPLPAYRLTMTSDL